MRSRLYNPPPTKLAPATVISGRREGRQALRDPPWEIYSALLPLPQPPTSLPSEAADGGGGGDETRERQPASELTPIRGGAHVCFALSWRGRVATKTLLPFLEG